MSSALSKFPEPGTALLCHRTEPRQTSGVTALPTAERTGRAAGRLEREQECRQGWKGSRKAGRDAGRTGRFAGRATGSCTQISAHFAHPVSLSKNHHRALGSTILIPDLRWSWSPA